MDGVLVRQEGHSRQGESRVCVVGWPHRASPFQGAANKAHERQEVMSRVPRMMPHGRIGSCF